MYNYTCTCALYSKIPPPSILQVYIVHLRSPCTCMSAISTYVQVLGNFACTHVIQHSIVWAQHHSWARARVWDYVVHTVISSCPWNCMYIHVHVYLAIPIHPKCTSTSTLEPQCTSTLKPHMVGTKESVHIRDVSSFQEEKCIRSQKQKCPC